MQIPTEKPTASPSVPVWNVPVRRACELLGGVTKAAERCGVAAATMSHYKAGALVTPERVAKAMEAATGGAVTALEIDRANKRAKAAKLLNMAEQLLDEAA